jgi:hypothetical protein
MAAQKDDQIRPLLETRSSSTTSQESSATSQEESTEILGIVRRLDDSLKDEYTFLLRLVLYGLDFTKEVVSQKTFTQLFDLLEKKIGPSAAVSIICHLLEEFGYFDSQNNDTEDTDNQDSDSSNKATGLEKYIDKSFNIRDYHEVDLRLTVAGFFFRLNHNDRKVVFRCISTRHLNCLSTDKMTSITDVVQLLCSRNVIAVKDITKIQLIAQEYQPGYFNDYCKRHGLEFQLTQLDDKVYFGNVQQPPSNNNKKKELKKRCRNLGNLCCLFLPCIILLFLASAGLLVASFVNRPQPITHPGIIELNDAKQGNLVLLKADGFQMTSSIKVELKPPLDGTTPNANVYTIPCDMLTNTTTVNTKQMGLSSPHTRIKFYNYFDGEVPINLLPGSTLTYSIHSSNISVCLRLFNFTSPSQYANGLPITCQSTTDCLSFHPLTNTSVKTFHIDKQASYYVVLQNCGAYVTGNLTVVQKKYSYNGTAQQCDGPITDQCVIDTCGDIFCLEPNYNECVLVSSRDNVNVTYVTEVAAFTGYMSGTFIGFIPILILFVTLVLLLLCLCLIFVDLPSFSNTSAV